MLGNHFRVAECRRHAHCPISGPLPDGSMLRLRVRLCAQMISPTALMMPPIGERVAFSISSADTLPSVYTDAEKNNVGAIRIKFSIKIPSTIIWPLHCAEKPGIDGAQKASEIGIQQTALTTVLNRTFLCGVAVENTVTVNGSRTEM